MRLLHARTVVASRGTGSPASIHHSVGKGGLPMGSRSVSPAGRQARALGKALLTVHLLVSLLGSSPWAQAVVYEYDDLDRLIRAEYDNGAKVIYTYDQTGNRLSRQLQSSLPPEVELAPLAASYSEYTWTDQGTISGTAFDRSGLGLECVEVSIRRENGGSGHFWNGTAWSAGPEIWNRADLRGETWRYALSHVHLDDGCTYTLGARASDRSGAQSLTGHRAFVYDSSEPVQSGGVQWVSRSSIRIAFSEPVTGADRPSSYRLTGGLSVVGVTRVDNTTYELTLSGDISPGTAYELTLSSIFDLAGNPVPASSAVVELRNHAPVAPSLHAPPDGSMVRENSPVLSVNNGSDPDGDPLEYEFELSETDDFSIPPAAETRVPQGQNITSWPLEGPLDEDTRYFWRSRVRDALFQSDWCEGSFFVSVENAPPSVPVPVSPVQGTQVETRNPMLVVINASDPEPGPLFYTFEVYSDEHLQSLVVSSGNVTEGPGDRTTFTLPEPLTDNAVFYWRARALDGEDLAGPWSGVSSFMVNTANDAPGPPAILSPQPGSEIQEVRPSFEVTNAQDPDYDALTYFFEVAADEHFSGEERILSGPVPEAPGQTTSWIPEDALAEDTTHHWRVRAYDGKTYGPWVEASFRIATSNHPPETPVLDSPVEEDVTDSTPELRVHPSADPDEDGVFYDFEVYTDYAMTQLVASGRSEEPFWEVGIPLSLNVLYVWRARAVDEHGATSDWTGPAPFVVIPGGQPPGAPVLNSPVNGGMVTTLNPVLSVTIGSAADLCEFEIYADGELDLLVEYGFAPADASLVSWGPEGSLEDGETYYWRCRTVTGELVSPWMDTASFTVNVGELQPELVVEARETVWPNHEAPARVEVHREESPIRGTVLEIPLGALEEPCEISIGRVVNPPAIPEGIQSVGHVLDFGPDGATFEEPVTVFLPLTVEEFQEIQESDLSAFRVMTYDMSTREWEAVPIQRLDPETQCAVFVVDHFSLYTAGRVPSRNFDEAEAEPVGDDSGCFLQTLVTDAGGAIPWPSAVVAGLIILALVWSQRGRFRSRKARKRSLWILLLMALPLIVPSTARATEASITVSGNEGRIVVSAQAHFTGYRVCNDEEPPDCWTVDSGRLYISHNNRRMGSVSGNGSAQWSRVLDGGKMSQGRHRFVASAVDYKSRTARASAEIQIDNTPTVTVAGPGSVEGLFDISGTAKFKEHVGGLEGRVELYIDGKSWRHRRCSKSYEGTEVSWSYEEMKGELLDAGGIKNGTHRIYVRARAHNGTWSEWAEGTFEVDNRPKVKVASPGLVEGLFDITGTVEFKEHAGGLEGRVEVYIDGKSWRHRRCSKSYEGTEVGWSYEEMKGELLDAGRIKNGTHRVYVRARAHNGTWSEWAEGTFEVDNRPKVGVTSPGSVEGLC